MDIHHEQQLCIAINCGNRFGVTTLVEDSGAHQGDT